MYEVELTAIVRDREQVLKHLQRYTDNSGMEVVYDDCYYSADILSNKEAELRLRLKHFKESDKHEAWLTFKKAIFDNKSRSKPEFETLVEDYQATKAILDGLGYQKDIAYIKNCLFFSFLYKKKRLELTLVELPELPDTYIEIELPTQEWEKVDGAFEVLYDFLEEINISQEDLSKIPYQEAVRASRAKN